MAVMPPSFFKTHYTWFLVGVLFTALFFFATYKLAETPPLWYDEGIYTQTAVNAFEHNGHPVLQTSPETFESAWHSNGGFSFIYPIALSYKLFGTGVLQGRGMMALFIFLFVVSVFIFIRRLYGINTALWSLLLLVTFPPLYGTGKSVLGEVPGLFYSTLFLLLLAHIEREQFRSSPHVFFLAGISVGLAAIAKPIFLLLPIAVVIVGTLRWRLLSWPTRWIVPATLGGIIPLILHLFLHLHDAPLAVLTHFYANPYGISNLHSMIFENVVRFFREPVPFYTLTLFIVWSSSCAWKIFRRIEISLAERIAFCFSALILLAYLRTAGWYRYFFITEILALVFLPSSLATLSSTTIPEWYVRLRAWAPKATLVCVGILSLVQLHSLLFNSWIANHNANSVTSTFTRAFTSISPTASVLFLDVPELVVLFPSHNYYQFLAPAPGFTVGDTSLDLLTKKIPDVVIVHENKEATYAPFLTSYRATSNDNGYITLQKNKQ